MSSSHVVVAFFYRTNAPPVFVTRTHAVAWRRISSSTGPRWRKQCLLPHNSENQAPVMLPSIAPCPRSDHDKINLSGGWLLEQRNGLGREYKGSEKLWFWRYPTVKKSRPYELEALSARPSIRGHAKKPGPFDFSARGTA